MLDFKVNHVSKRGPLVLAFISQGYFTGTWVKISPGPVKQPREEYCWTIHINPPNTFLKKKISHNWNVNILLHGDIQPEILLPFARQVGKLVIKTITSHRDRIVTTFLRQEGISKMERPAYLPDPIEHTVYPKKYAHGFCFAVLCCGYTLTDFPISIRLTSLALWQSNDCPSASKATLMNMDKHFMWIHYERLHIHNKAKHNKTVCIFLGIYCIWNELCRTVIRMDYPWQKIGELGPVSI